MLSRIPSDPSHLPDEVFVRKLFPVDGLPACPISAREVPALGHEPRDDAMKQRVLTTVLTDGYAARERGSGGMPPMEAPATNNFGWLGIQEDKALLSSLESIPVQRMVPSEGVRVVTRRGGGWTTLKEKFRAWNESLDTTRDRRRSGSGSRSRLRVVLTTTSRLDDQVLAPHGEDYAA